MMANALAKLDGAPEDYYGWDIARFRDHLRNAISEKSWVDIKV